MTKKNEAGFTGVFASSSSSAECPSCEKMREEDVIIGDIVPLTTILYDYINNDELIREGAIKEIPSLEPEVVEPFLKENLKWRMIDLKANLLEGREEQAKLEITVTSRIFVPPAEGSLMGVYEPYTAYPGITNDKPGGFGYVYA
jgi:hypothetical protein